MNRYPRRCTVATNRGAPAGSPRALRISRTQTFSTASPTTVAGQTASSRASLVTSWPGRSTRHWSTAKAFGVRRIAFVPRHRHALTASSLKEAKRSCRAGLDFVVTLSPGSYRCLTSRCSGAQGNTTRVPERVDRRAPGPHFGRRGRTSGLSTSDSLRSSPDFSFPRTGRGCPGIYGVSHYRNLTPSSCLEVKQPHAERGRGGTSAMANRCGTLNRMRDAQQEEGPCEAGGKAGGGCSCSAP